MLLWRFLRRVLQDRSRSKERPRRTERPRLRLEPLEDRVLPSLLGLASQAVQPDITSGAMTNMSYTQVGNNSNPFHYDAIPLAITLGDGSRATITKATGGTTATMSLNLLLDNSGKFSSGGPASDFNVTGSVTIAGHNFNGTLLTGQARDFGFSNPNRADTEFEVRLVVTGGLLTQQPYGVFQAGTGLAMLLHQPNLTITSFPQSFSLSKSPAGAADTKKLIEGVTNSEPDGCG
jgi:hypothetical protein